MTGLGTFLDRSKAIAHAAALACGLATCAPQGSPTIGAARPALTPAPSRGSAGQSLTMPAPPDAGAPTTGGPGAEADLVARTLRRVESIRGLAAIRPVPGVVLSREELIDRVKAHVIRELPPEAIRNEGRALQLFGFIPIDFDYEAATYRLLRSQLAGYYEPSDGTMYMAADLGTDDAKATLAHELVHALQDQHWDLEARSRYRAGQGDLAETVSALAEGDATSAMLDVMIARALPGRSVSAANLPEDVFADQMRQAMAASPGADAPHVMRTSLVAPYLYGTLFVNALRRRGGWAAVDRAWTDAPSTSEQILHVEKWDAHEPALTVPPPPFATLGQGWHVADEDSEGELGTRITFEEWMPADAAARASAGWGGDRGVLLTHDDLMAFAWRLQYDATAKRDELAARSYDVITHALTESIGAPSVTAARFACRERPDRGPFAIARDGEDLLVVLGPARVGTTEWTSAGSCELSRRWVAEIAAPRRSGDGERH
ncbi:MAG: hypothetical protein FWD17_18240 [Polyangiaceae bacterium]|nr:hypothetical protein [Polyangiaceae bacterium]